MRLELYLLIVGVTVSQSDVVRLAALSGDCELHVTYMPSSARCSESNALDCVDCGGCLHDV